MTKQLIIGLATIAITGTALLATGMYAASGSNNNMDDTTNRHGHQMVGKNQENPMNTLS
jgi:hypothetical protein